MINKKHNLLDHGFVRLVDYMGDDQRVIDAARVSYADGTKSIRDKEQLIDFLMYNSHMSPFEHVEFEFHIKAPMCIAEHLLRYRTASINKKSGRYSVMRDEYYIPNIKDIKDNKHNIVPKSIAGITLNRLCESSDFAFKSYDLMLADNIARETARMNLPLSTYTEMYWKIDLRNLLNFLKQRISDHAQFETQMYAKTIGDMIKKIVPLSYAAFEEHVLHAVRLSRSQVELLKTMLDNDQLKALKIA